MEEFSLYLWQYNINNDALSFNMIVLTAVYRNKMQYSNEIVATICIIYYGDDERLVSIEVEKTKGEQDKLGISTLTCHYCIDDHNSYYDIYRRDY